jgi:hypothetical protein
MVGFWLKTEITMGLEWVYRTDAAKAVPSKDISQSCGCECAPKNHHEELSGSEAKGKKSEKDTDCIRGSRVAHGLRQGAR